MRATAKPSVVPPLMVGDKPVKFADDKWEAPRETIGLKLVGELVDKAESSWNYIVNDESRRSFAAYQPNGLSQEDSMKYFNIIKEGTDWQQPQGNMGPIPRKTAWMVWPGCQCSYRYGSIEVPPADYPPWMVELLTMIMPKCGIHDKVHWPNACNLNLYLDGGMSVGWHSDDERLFQGKFQDIRIISLSFGARRKFELRANWPEDGEAAVRCMMLGNGDLCTMEGMMQKHYQHRVPKEGGVNGPRINLTWRWTLKHTPQCPASRMRMR